MSLANTRDPNSLSSKLRNKRDIRLRELIASVAQKKNGIRIIDIGGTHTYWKRLGIEFLREHNAHVTLVNLVETELLPNAEHSDVFTAAVGSGCDLNMFQDNAFDLVHSNSVIEHVRGWDNMVLFAKEVRRVAPSYYVQTPYFWFPFDPHFYKMPFFHWFPRPIRTRMLMHLPLAYSGKMGSFEKARFAIDGAVLLNRQEMRFLFPDANMTFEWFLALPKSMIAIRNGE